MKRAARMQETVFASTCTVDSLKINVEAEL